MSTTVDDEVRAGLQRWAAEVPDGPGDPYDAMRRRARPRAGRRLGVRWAAVAAAAAVAVTGLALRPTQPSSPGSDPATSIPAGTDQAPPTAHPATPGPPAIADFPTVLLRADGWRLHGARILRFTDGTSLPEYGFLHADGRQFELSLYAIDGRTPGSAPRPDEHRTVHGQPAFATAEGPPRYRLDWVEFARMWEADGKPFASLDEFTATMEKLELVDEAAFREAVPQLADAVANHPNRSVTWVTDQVPRVEEAEACLAPPPYSCGGR
jgi:hypothetical protein